MPSRNACTPLASTSSSLAGTLSVIWVSWLVVFGILGITQPEEWLVGLLLSFHAAVTLLATIAFGSRIGMVLVGGLLFRIALLYLDLYTGVHVFGSGGDTENFFKTALAIYQSPDLLSQELYGGIYPKLCALLFFVVGPSRLFVQYLNVLFAVSSILLTSMSMECFSVDARVKVQIVAIMSFMPINAALSAVFLREAPIAFLVALSILCFSKWLVGGRVIWLALAAVLTLCGSSFHLGVVGLTVGYILAIMTYDPDSGEIRWTVGGWLKAIVLTLAVVAIAARNPGLFLEKLERASSVESVYGIAMASDAGSAYLSGVHINSASDFFLWLIPKGVMLLVAPLPWHWRGLNDAASFMLDSLFFLGAMVIIVKALRRTVDDRRRPCLRFLSLSLVCAILLLGVGTSAAGTALRHRQKLVPVVAVVTALSLSTGGFKARTVEAMHSHAPESD